MNDPYIFPWLVPTWNRLVKNLDCLHHALLLHGEPGIGKTAFGLCLGMLLLCERKKSLPVMIPSTKTFHADAEEISPRLLVDACGACDACLWYLNDAHPDCRFLGAFQPTEISEPKKQGETLPEKMQEQLSESDSLSASLNKKSSNSPGNHSQSINLDSVVGLADFLQISSHRQGPKIVFIDPADFLNRVAVCALLKILEEPSLGTHFILITDDPYRLPATIRSRCLWIRLPSPSFQEAISWIKNNSDSGLVSEDLAKENLLHSGGSVLRALDFVSPEVLAVRRSLLETITGFPQNGVVRVAEVLSKTEMALWRSLLCSWVSDLVFVSAEIPPRFYPDKLARLKELVLSSDFVCLVDFYEYLIRIFSVSSSLNVRLFCEAILLRFYSVLSLNNSS